MTDTVAIFSPHDDIRLLLRSLLRLHHYRVVREGSNAAELRALPPGDDPTVVVDADLEEVGWSEAVQSLRQGRPKLRFVLVTPSRSPRTDTQALSVGISTVLRRPFAMRQLIDAMQSADPPVGPAPPPGAAPV